MRHRFRPARLIAFATAAALLVQPWTAPLANGSPDSTAQVQPDLRGGSSQDEPPTIKLIQQDATVAPDGSFAAFLEVEGAPEGSDLAIDIHPLVDDEELLDEALAGEPRNSLATFPVVDLPPAIGSGPVQTGFVINLYSSASTSPGGGWAKRLDDAGVYPVRVRLRGPDSRTLSTLVTFLVRGPDDDDELEPAQVALVPELEQGASGIASLELDATPLDPETANSIETVVDTFAAHPDVPASFVVPSTLARRMAASADGESGSGSPGTDDDDGSEPDSGGDGAATTTSTGPASGETTTSNPDDDSPDDGLVARFRAVLAGDHRELLAGTFVEIDPTQLTAAGLTSEVARQHELGFRYLAGILEAPEAGTWLVRQRLDARTIDALADLGVDELLVPTTSVDQPDSSLPARARGASSRSRVTALDPTMATGGNTDPALAAQLLFGQAIARAAISDGAPQIITVPMPESVEDVAELDSLLALLDEHDGFVAPRRVTDLLQASPTAPDPVLLSPPQIQSLGSYPAGLLATRTIVDAYASMTRDRPDLAANLSEQLSRSATRGLTNSQRGDIVDGVRHEVEAQFAGVTIPTSDRVTLGARDAQFPLVISSSSDVPLRVIVDLASASDRLTVKHETVEVLLDSDRTVVPVQVHSRSPGDTPVHITVKTLDGQVILSEGTYSIRSTAVSGVGLLLTVGAGLFLALWWGRHFFRSRRTKARHAR